MRRPLDATPRPLVLSGRALPVVGRARVYVCGITPYDVTHLGHAATFVWVDTAVRVLRELGTTVEVCRNITDVDDVLTAAADRAGTPYDRFAAMHQYAFERDVVALGVARPEHEPRAHNYVGNVVELAAALLARGVHAYVVDGTVYFRGRGIAEGRDLAPEEAAHLLREYGEDPDDPAKEHPHDVPVWRSSTPGQPAWPSPWGPGRPGWHAECTAMALTTYGPALDLHAGGADLAYPHHAYEAAHAEAATGVRPFARAWMHVGTVRVRGEKMAKSTGNLVLVSDVLRGATAAAVRLAILDRPWAEPWDWADSVLADAAARLERLYSAAGRPGGGDATGGVREALSNDLDVPRALEVAEEAGGAAARTALRVLGLDGTSPA
ncbi:MAG TPA: cysteine--1-D-myo-inosityl 2-amino-2-deoxy-alpha-D-glucopyranoside ligase [Jiangellales bacterium]|nr:cysteine--1-D-myo-inosityl 2-amino-2-deoxy-alpha-D-glucopyranoside ligase [Jiangellales bacterium]